MKRQAEIALAVGAPVRLARFHVRERMSECFAIDAEVFVDRRIDFLPHLGKPAAIQVYEAGKPVRPFHALLVEAHYVRQEDEGFRYHVVLRPWLSLLGHNRDYRIYEEKSVLDILKDVLRDYSRRVDYGKLSGRYKPWPYCTQYRESDLAFLSRLMEREGLYYYFRHEKDDHVLVLADARTSHRPAKGYEKIRLRPDAGGGDAGLADALRTWQEHVGTQGQAKFLLQSFDYTRTRTQNGRTDGPKRNPADAQEVYEYTGDFVEPSLAKQWTQVRLEAARARQRVYTGSGDPIGIACGARFALDSNEDFNRGDDFIVVALDYEMDAEPYRTGDEGGKRRVAIEAAPLGTPWRAPIVTPWPTAGTETAIVVAGGADDTNADAMGRVRVRFLWGKPGEPPAKARSCWLRVSHPSAGAGFGHVALPRLDEEVLVDFLDGNPDRPIVTGRVYNSDHAHAYGLPTDRTRTLFRSQTIGRSGSYAGAERPATGKGYNELSFEDRGGREEVYVRAQRNRRLEVLLDDDEKVRRDRTVRVGRDRTTAIRKSDSTRVEMGDSSLDVLTGGASTTAMRDISLRVGANSIRITPAGITLTAGPAIVSITPAGITMTGVTITATAATTATVTSPMTTVTGAATLNLVGAVINLKGVPVFM